MERMIACRRRMESLRCQVRAQVGTLATLEKAFAQETEHLRRHDQAQCLEALRARVTQEVGDMERMETSASFSFTKVTLIGGLAKFALGSLAAAWLRTEEHPLSVGAKVAASAFGRTKPFGTVVVAVGPGGVPDDVNVVPVSQRARELGSSEAEIAAVLEARDYLLMAPQTFFKVLDELEDRVLRGIIALPVARDSFLMKPADGISQ